MKEEAQQDSDALIKAMSDITQGLQNTKNHITTVNQTSAAINESLYEQGESLIAVRDIQNNTYVSMQNTKKQLEGYKSVWGKIKAKITPTKSTDFTSKDTKRNQQLDKVIKADIKEAELLKKQQQVSKYATVFAPGTPGFGGEVNSEDLSHFFKQTNAQADSISASLDLAKGKYTKENSKFINLEQVLSAKFALEQQKPILEDITSNFEKNNKMLDRNVKIHSDRIGKPKKK